MNSPQQSEDFFEKVWKTVEQIPKGRVTTYGAIARFLGTAKSSRVVGYALTALKSEKEDIPAHRVVNRQGLLTGKLHFSGKSMEERLAEEGVLVKNNAVVDFDKLFWNPESLIR